VTDTPDVQADTGTADADPAARTADRAPATTSAALGAHHSPAIAPATPGNVPHRQLGPPLTDSGAERRPRRRRPPDGAAGGERSTRDLIGAGPSQVGVSGALRARDVDRPSDADLAEAEAQVVLIHRNWTPDAKPEHP
jgi:hypothetical protein